MTTVEGQVALVSLGMLIMVLLASLLGHHWAVRYEQREAETTKPIAQEANTGPPLDIIPAFREVSGL